jgi:hypothetical protein
MSNSSTKKKTRLPVWLWVVLAIIVWAIVFVWLGQDESGTADTVAPVAELSAEAEIAAPEVAPEVAADTAPVAVESEGAVEDVPVQLPPPPAEVMLQIMNLFDW